LGQSPQGHACASKWWHVADSQIEDMIQRLNEPQDLEVTRRSHLRSSALKNSPSDSQLWQRSVHFSDNGQDNYQDALDRALQEDRLQPEKKKGSWRVSDQTLINFINNAKKTLANEVEQVVASDRDCLRVLERSASVPAVSRAVPSNSAGLLSPARQHANPTMARYASGHLQPPSGVAQRSERHIQGRQFQQGQRASKPGPSIRSKNSYSRNVLAMRPAWNLPHSAPNIFAGVGVGLDGKGNKLISESAKFEETPIYLGDARNSSLERVRVAVCGHPYYMARN